MLGLLQDKKKLVQIILSESPKIEEKEVPQGLEGDFGKAIEAAANELIEGVKAGEPRMVGRAFKQLIHLCDKEEEYTTEEGE